VQCLWALGLTVCLWFVLNRRRFGEHLLFIGDNVKVAEIVGVNTKREKTRAFAVMGFLAAFGVWLLGGGVIWLAASILIGAVVPFTFLGIMPTNHKLLAPDRDRASPETRTLLQKWGWLHGVRTALSIIATALMLWGLHGV